MRFLIRATLPLDVRKSLAAEPIFRKAIGRVLDENKVEALFFGEENAKHCIFFVVNVRDGSHVRAIGAPLRAVAAQVEFLPATESSSMQKVRRAS
jgi:hypothetical protein